MAKKKTVKKKPARKKTVAKKKRAAKKKPVNKSQAIRDYLKTHKNAGSKEVQAALAKKGIKVTAALVSNVKSNAKKKKNTGTKVKVRVVKKAVERTPLQELKEAGSLMVKAVELVMSAGAAEAKQLISTAAEIVKKAQGED
jgi:arginine repressor